MPNCFQLFRKTEPTKAVVFQDIDRELCAYFNEPCHDVQWFHGWYNYIGFALAMGNDWTKLEADITDIIREREATNDKDGVAYWQRMQDIRLYLAERFNSDAWYEVKR